MAKDAKDIKIPDIGKKYGASLKNLFFIFWVMAAFGGALIATGLGIAHNDWIVFSSEIAADGQELGWYLAVSCASVGGAIMGLYGLLSILRKRQWLLLLPCLALGAAFPALLIAPQWSVFAFGGGALALGVVALKLSDRKATRAAKNG